MVRAVGVWQLPVPAPGNTWGPRVTCAAGFKPTNSWHLLHMGCFAMVVSLAASLGLLAGESCRTWARCQDVLRRELNLRGSVESQRQV